MGLEPEPGGAERGERLGRAAGHPEDPRAEGAREGAGHRVAVSDVVLELGRLA